MSTSAVLPDSESMAAPYSLSGVQQIALALTPIPVALLSVFSSSLIIQHVLWRGTKRSTSYHRILLAMSAFDILYSITSCLQMFLMPQESSERKVAIGNETTCTVMGFFTQLSLATYWYNGMLSIYYITTIVYSWTDKGFAKVEPFLHTLCILFSIITATMGAVIGWYSEMDIGFGCWVNRYPRGCELLSEDGLTMGEPCRSDEIAWYIAAIPITLILFMVVLGNLHIYCHVRSVILKSQRHDFEGSTDVMTPSGNTSITFRRTSDVGSSTQVKRIRQVALQGFLYVLAFWLTYIFNAVVRLIEAYDVAEKDSEVYPILILQAVLSPSTGFFNMLIYFRPRYVRCRQSFPDESRWWAIKHTLWDNQSHSQNANTESRRPVLSRHHLGISGRWLQQTASRDTYEEPPSATLGNRGDISDSFQDETPSPHPRLTGGDNPSLPTLPEQPRDQRSLVSKSEKR